MKAIKRMLCLVVSLLVVFSLAACGTTPNDDASPSPSAAAPEESTAPENVVVNVDYMFNMESGTDAKGVAVAKAIERMKADYPNIEISLNTVAHDDYQTKILTDAASGTLPDVFNVKGSWLKNLVTNGQVGNMDEYFAADPEWKDQFIPDSFIDMTYDGSVWGAPFQMLTCGNIFYNEAIFAEAGYDHFPTTWDEYIDCLKAIKEKGYTPIVMGNKGLWVANSCYFGTLCDRTAGQEWYDGIMANDGSASFTDPEVILAMQKFAELAEIGAFNEDMNSIDNIQMHTPYYNGEAASFYDGNWGIADMLVNCPEDILNNTGIAVLPTVEGGKGEAGRVAGGSAWGNAYAASLEGAQRDAAVLFIKYTTDDAYGTDLLDAGDFPGVAVADYDYSKLAPFAKEYFDFRSTMVMSPMYDCHFDTNVIDAMNVGFQEVLTGQITPEQWGEQVQAEYEMTE